MGDLSEQARARAARAGEALPDGSYPVRDCGEVNDAVTAYGRAPESHRPALRALIRKQNDALRCGINLDKLEEV